MEFKKVERSPRQENGYRLASVEEVRNNFQTIKDGEILDSWDIVRLLDGWVTGPGYRYELQVGYHSFIGHMMVVKTGASREASDDLLEFEEVDAVIKLRNEEIQKLYSGIELGDEGRKAALLLSCDDKNSEVIYWLLSTIDQAELDRLTNIVNQTFREGKTVLHYAIESGNQIDALNVAKFLLDKYEFGKELVRKCDKYGRSVLHLASLHDDHACLCGFLINKCGLRVEEKDRYGQNALHFAAKGKSVEVMKKLLSGSSEGRDKEILVKSRDEKGKTPLHIAAARGNTPMVEYLLKFQSQKQFVREGDLLGQTALHEAASGGHKQTMETLLEFGSDPLAERDGDRKTALHYAAQLDDPDNACAEAVLLLKSCKSDGEKYLLLWASAVGVGTAEESASSSKVKDFLCQEKNKIKSSLGSDADNLLRLAASLGQKEMTWELISRGADIDDIGRNWSDSLESNSQQKQNVLKVLEQIKKIPERGRDQPAMEDNLGRSVFAKGLAALFINPYVKTPVTVGISGEWGMGKSSLMKQTEIILLKAAAQLAFPNLLSTENFPGVKKTDLSPKGRKKYKKITKEVKSLLASADHYNKEENPLVHFLGKYRSEYDAVFKSLAFMDRREMFTTIGESPDSKSEGHEMGELPSILTVQYNAWHYRNESQAWAGLAVEITKVMEETMTNAQAMSTRWRYAWNSEHHSIWLELILPCLLATFLAGWVASAAWMLLSRSQHKELSDLKYGSIPITIIAIVWTVVSSVMSVLKPISVQLMGYIRLPDHTGNLGYQQKVISDINFLKEEISQKPCWIYSLMAGEWCWNWFGLYNNNIKGTSIPKMTPASKDNLRIIAFVDDLDRCPDTVILQILSAINLVLAACEINVILGMDKKMIETAIANQFQGSNQARSQIMSMEMAEDLADKFVRKIIQLPLALPDPSKKESESFLAHHLGRDEARNEKTQTQAAGSSIPLGNRPEREAHSSSGNHVVDLNNHNEGVSACARPLAKVSQLLKAGYREGEQEAFFCLREFATDSQKLPREWKRLLNYHRLAWNILSESAQVKRLAGWQVQLVAWIFCCWQWKDEINILIQNWHKFVVIKSNIIHGELEGNGDRGPSLRNIIDYYIDEKWPHKDVVGENLQAKQDNQTSKSISNLYDIKTPPKLSKEEVVEQEKEEKEKEGWNKLKEALIKYDVSMTGIQLFQRFRFHCETEHLPWPLSK